MAFLFQSDFADALKDGAALCELINALRPGSVKKINTMKAPFKQVGRKINQNGFKNKNLSSFSFQRENIELFLKGCEAYGLKTQDLFQVNDLYEAKNVYMVVDNLHTLGGQVSHGTIFDNKLIPFMVSINLRLYSSSTKMH